MIDEWSGTLTLTEASSRELMRVLEKQDAEFMDALFNGECGFTLKCTDGRSVELVPKADRKTEPQTEVETMSCAECKHRPIGAEICEEACHYEPQTDWHYDEQDATWYPYKHEDEPQTEKPKIRKRIDKPFRAVWLDDDHNEIGTPQTERSE